MPERPTLSVVIPTYNRVDRLRRVLTALAAQDLDPGEFEVVAVSDGSTDGTDTYLASGETPLPVVHRRQDNAGPAAARNHGIEVARGEIIVFVDDDLVPEPTMLSRHLAVHRALGDDVVVIGPMSDPPDFEFSPWTKWEQRMLRKQYDAMRDGLYGATPRQFYTGNASIRRAHLLAVGCFDPRFRRMEDLELAYRLDELSLRWIFAPDAVGHHYAERSYDAWLRIAYDYGRNDVIFGRDHARPDVLASIAGEYRRRKAPLRALLRVSVPSRTISRAVQWPVERYARSRWSTRLDRLSRASLSCAYNDAYYRGVADELGGHREFRRLVRTAGSAKRVLLTVSGEIPADLTDSISNGARPRADYLEMARAFDADLLDRAAARRAGGRTGRVIRRLAGDDALMAWACFRGRRHYDLVFTDGEQVGLPLALLLRFVRRRPRHFMIVHILSVPKKAWLFRLAGLGRRIDRLFVYADAQATFAHERLGVPRDSIVLTPFMVDTEFFAPAEAPPNRDRPLISSAGLEFRDYPTMIDAVRGLDVDVVIAAASPWSKRRDNSADAERPPNVVIDRLSLHELRDLYVRSDLVVVPLIESDFQAGITTILEAMAMGKPLICSHTIGQTDTIVDGHNGVYVPPGDAPALRAAIERLLVEPDVAGALGTEARRWAVEHASIDVYVRRLAGDVSDALATPRPGERTSEHR